MKRSKKTILIIAAPAVCACALAAAYVLYLLNVIPHRAYTNEDFGIAGYVSPNDADGDGVDDQSDILASARAYIATEPRYKSKYYAGGYPDDEFGVCTDVIARALLGAGYDLQELVDADVAANGDNYAIDRADRNIDFRRVRNLLVYFGSHAQSLTTDIYDIGEWQGGDIVVFEKHIALVSDKRNKNGVAFIIHHASPRQYRYEEDVLERRGDIVGHFRITCLD